MKHDNHDDSRTRLFGVVSKFDRWHEQLTFAAVGSNQSNRQSHASHITAPTLDYTLLLDFYHNFKAIVVMWRTSTNNKGSRKQQQQQQPNTLLSLSMVSCELDCMAWCFVHCNFYLLNVALCCRCSWAVHPLHGPSPATCHITNNSLGHQGAMRAAHH
jgi:hypothetical protein